MHYTVRTSTSVKVMLSYDYCHFEVSTSLQNEGGVSNEEIDTERKEVQRLADHAVKQYKVAKSMAANRTNGNYRMSNFESECKKIQTKLPDDRTVKEIAMLKQYEDENWRSQFDYEYDYEDEKDDEILSF